MEKRIGAAIILIEDKSSSAQLNSTISRHSHLIIGRQGIPLPDKGISIITLIIEGNTDEIGAMTGQIGRIKGLQIKSVLLKPSNNTLP